MDAFLSVDGVTKAFGAATVLEGIDLAVARGEFVALLGPSGCGKTTLLRILAGLVEADAGRLRLAGADITRLPPHRRNIGVVFQNYALFPHLNVADNVAFGLKLRGVARVERDLEVATALRLVQMEAFAGRSVKALSGGQQQRVALARVLAIKPDLLLLDEPLAALDRKLRESVQVELRQLLRRLGITSVFVTHDQEEALVLADRIGVMNAGRLEQLSTPSDLYRRPRTRFVLDFVGRSCFLRGTTARSAGGLVEVATALGAVRAAGGFLPDIPVEIGVRPETLRVGGTPSDDSNRIVATVTDRIFVGSRTMLTFDTPAGERLVAEIDGTDESAVPGTAVTVWWPVTETHLYPTAA